MHVRRTDKIVQKEAKIVPVEKYFDRLQQFYNENPAAGAASVKRVFLATDDTDLIAESRKKYPQYTFVVNEVAAKGAADVDKRSKFPGMVETIFDILMLAECDVQIVTFSSNIGRLLLELGMYNKNGDAERVVISMDEKWKYEWGSQWVSESFLFNLSLSLF